MLRSLAVQKLKTANNKLADAIINKKINLIEKYHEEVHDQFTVFENSHMEYGVKAGISMDDQEMKEMYNEVTDMVDLADASCMNYQKNQMRIKFKLFKDWDHILLQVQDINDQIGTGDGRTVGAAAVESEIEYLEERYRETLKPFESLCESLNELELEEIMEKKNSCERKYRFGLMRMRTYIEVSTASRSASSRSLSPSKGSNYRFKKIQFPQFSGVLRQYITFKRDFNDIVVEPRHYDKKQMSHILRNECLQGEAKLLVHNIHDYDHLWTKLDDKYNDRSEVIDQVSKEIQGLMKVQEEDYDDDDSSSL